MIPINPDDDFKRSELHRDIERMAFNVHLCWEKNLPLDLKRLRAEFRQPYYHRSCVSNVISLKYKLHGIGIDADRLSTDECAAALDERLANDRSLEDSLMYYEHRRWVAEKICGGWINCAPSDCRTGVMQYIHKSPQLTIGDLFAFRQSDIVRRDKPEFFNEYKALWRLYRRSPRVWKKLCDWLTAYDSDDERAAIEKIIVELKNNEIVDVNSKIVVSTTAACEVFMEARAVDKRSLDQMSAEFDRLFSNPYVLTNPNVISVRSRGDQIFVRLDDLIVRQLQRPVESDIIQLLRDLRDIGCITDLRIDTAVVSFTYPTLPIKHLLIQADKILEIYVWHKLLASGLFDDISCGCVITWRDTEASNEFDCLLTKGFNSYFIECKRGGRTARRATIF